MLREPEVSKLCLVRCEREKQWRERDVRDVRR